jgi:hypothetical protein
MNRTLKLIAPTFLLAVTVLAQSPDKAQPARQNDAPPATRVLDQRVPEVRFQEAALDQVIQWVTDVTRINVSVRWSVLQDAGVNRDTPISLQARNLRLTQVLWLIMNEAGGTDARLAYRVSGNLLVLSTADDLNREMITKVYDVADLLVNIPTASRRSNMDVTQGLGHGNGSATCFVSGSDAGSDEDAGSSRAGEAEQVKSLIELIQQTIEPHTWGVNGGVGTIVAFRRVLVVRNTLAVHQLLGGYLTEAQAGTR